LFWLTGTYCQQREVEAITEDVESDDGKQSAVCILLLCLRVIWPLMQVSVSASACWPHWGVHRLQPVHTYSLYCIVILVYCTMQHDTQFLIQLNWKIDSHMQIFIYLFIIIIIIMPYSCTACT